MAQQKNMPKDGQVIMAIMKEMGITEYEPKTVIQLTEFVYRYVSTVLEEARQFTNHCNKKTLELDHVRLALSLQNECTFTTPPSREIALECARLKNSTPLPLMKPPCGLRLPPDRYCLASPNYLLKANAKKSAKTFTTAKSATAAAVVKRTNIGIVKQAVNITRAPQKPPNPNLQQQQKTILKPKIQITQNIQLQKAGNKSDAQMDFQDAHSKRKRQDSEERELS